VLIGTRLLLARIALDDEAAQSRLLKALPREERERIGLFHHAADRSRAIAAAILPRLVIYRLRGIPLAEVALPRTRAGKPWYPDDPGFHFNLSHSGEYVALAIGSHPVGVDCEQTRMNRDTDAIARRFFSAAEQQWLAGCHDSERARRFFELWSRKESLLKATGAGLSGSLASFDARPGPRGDGSVAFRGGRWFIRSYATLECYSMAICAGESDLPDHPHQIDARAGLLEAADTALGAFLSADCRDEHHTNQSGAA